MRTLPRGEPARRHVRLHGPRQACAPRTRKSDTRLGTSGSLDDATLPLPLQILAVVVAPTTLLTGLMFYFGWLHAYWFSNYFGVNSTVLGFTTQDYLMRSVDSLLVPMTLAGGVTLMAMSAHRRLLRAETTRTGRKAVRAIEKAVVLVGTALTAIGFSYIAHARILVNGTISAASLAAGAILLLYGRSLRRRRLRAAPLDVVPALALWMASFVVVGAGLFLAAGDLSARIGTGRARATVASLATTPRVIVYSGKDLALRYMGITETDCGDPDSMYRYRYDGLRLVLQSGNTYLLIPDGWSPTTGHAIVLPRSDDLRLDFTPPGSAGQPRPAESGTCA